MKYLIKSTRSYNAYESVMIKYKIEFPIIKTKRNSDKQNLESDLIK